MSNKLTKISAVIEEISMGPFGSDIKVENFVSQGVPVLNGSNLTSFKLVEDTFKYVTPEKAKTFKKAIARRGDIVITHRGTLGQISYIPKDSLFDEYVISQSQFRVSLNKNLVDPSFFVYYFHTSEGQKRLLANKCHVGVPALAQATTNFRLIEIPLPSLATQQKIASVLTALNAKIELNNRINTELEAMAKTLYDYWFVQFDFPNEAGKPYKSSGGTMVWNEELKREIPEGWEVKELWEVIEIKYGKDHKHLNFGSIPVFGSGGIMRYADKALYDYESILIPRKGTLSNLFYLNKPFWSVDTMFFSKMKIVHIGKFLFYFLHSLNLASLNAGTAVPSLTTEILNKLKIVIPSSNILKKFDTVLTPAFEMKEQVTKENQQLSELRDWLLPMLMNGQVKVQ
ncbi:restriction endonuclease subunit S [Runella salmonicolor]|uniref:Restriction endonuclease subunit S n=1 Tax=Runella salmonicolor TaxID=2950278 RepID=A0ABT1FZM9_9BACT|nr:restriction endonuclease subunit S [Runella salmonicolor]MCP1386263.1 restriction endonuclease subunit S [Runella salmonicolor]